MSTLIRFRPTWGKVACCSPTSSWTKKRGQLAKNKENWRLVQPSSLFYNTICDFVVFYGVQKI